MASERSVETARRVPEGQMYQPTLSFVVTMLLDDGERERAAELFDELFASLREVLDATTYTTQGEALLKVAS